MGAQIVHQAKARRAWMFIAACITVVVVLGAAPFTAAQAANPHQGLATTGGADVSVSVSANSGLSAGDDAVIFFKVSNIGDTTATNVTLSDDLSMPVSVRGWQIDPAVPGCTITGYDLECAWASLAANADITVRVTAGTGKGSCNLLYNAPHVGASNDINPGNNTLTFAFEILCPAMQIEMVPDPLSGVANAGDLIGFTLQMTNNGPGTAHTITVTDTLPSNLGLQWSVGDTTLPGGTAGTCAISAGVLSCSFDQQLPGADNMISIKLVSPTTPASCGTVENTASVSAANDGTAEAGDSITVNCPVMAIQMVPVPASGTANAGDAVGFTIQVTNTGAGTARNVSISDTLPTIPGLEWSVGVMVAPNDTVGFCTVSTGSPQELSCNFDQLTPGVNRYIEINIESPTTLATACSTIDYTATVSAGNDGSAQASSSIGITCASLGITKEPVASQVDAGSEIGYNIHVSSSGLSAVGNGVITDTLPSVTGLSWSLGGIAAPNDAGISCSIDTQVVPNVLTCTFDQLDAGREIIVGLSSPTTTASCGVVSNTASVTAGNAAAVVTPNSLITVNCPPPQTTAQIAPPGATCGDFKAGTAATLSNGVTYTVQNSRIRTTSPAAFIYYSKVIAPAATFQIKVAQSNPGGWPNLGNYFSFFNPQINVYNSACTRINTTGTFLPSSITFRVTGATPGAEYYVGIRYQADSVVGKAVTTPYPSVPYTFTTLVDSTLLDPNTVSLTFHP